MSVQSDVYTRILGSVSVATGSPDNDALENYDTFVLDDGAICYVSTGAGSGAWQLEKTSSTPPDGITVVAPITGPGRWVKRAVPGPPGVIYYQTVQDPLGVALTQQPILQFAGSSISVTNDGPGNRTVVTVNVTVPVDDVTADTNNFVTVTEPVPGTFQVNTPNARILASNTVCIGGGTPTNPAFAVSVYLGFNSGVNHTGGGGANTFVGAFSGGNLSGAGSNTGFGYQSGNSLSGTAAYNTLVGYSATGIGAVTNCVVIGANSNCLNTGIVVGTNCTTTAVAQTLIGQSLASPPPNAYFLNLASVLTGYTQDPILGFVQAAIGAGPSASLSSQTSRFCVYMAGGGASTIPLYSGDNSATAGGVAWNQTQSTSSPVGTIAATPGSWHIRANGTNSAFYIHVGAAPNSTDWARFVLSGQITPTDFATSAKTLTIIDTASVTYNVASATDFPFKLVRFSAATSIVLPNDATDPNMPIGACIQFVPTTATMATFSVSGGGTLQGEGGANKSAAQYGVVVATKVAANTWLLSGRITV